MEIYLIGMYYNETDKSDVQDIVKATTSYEAARQYILDKIETHRKRSGVSDFRSCESESKYCWDIFYNWKIGKDKTHSVEVIFRIEPIELIDTEDVPNIRRPELEKRCESLEKHNDELKKEISDLKKNNSAAQCYLTFWDGGKYEDFDHVLKNINVAKEILRGGEQGNNHILKLFEGWQRNEHN